jgi:hypothetical protein
VPGETDLRALLAAMMPTLRPETYVFRTLPPGESLPAEIVPFATVREDEGLTVVVERQPACEPAADDGFRAITLGVQSSLNAVGFIAAVARALADACIPANVIAGYHHDHVLVPTARAEQAMAVLRDMAASPGRCNQQIATSASSVRLAGAGIASPSFRANSK